MGVLEVMLDSLLLNCYVLLSCSFSAILVAEVRASSNSGALGERQLFLYSHVHPKERRHAHSLWCAGEWRICAETSDDVMGVRIVLGDLGIGFYKRPKPSGGCILFFGEPLSPTGTAVAKGCVEKYQYDSFS